MLPVVLVTLALGEDRLLSNSPPATLIASRIWLSNKVPPGVASRFTSAVNSAVTAACTAAVLGLSPAIVKLSGTATGASTVTAAVTGRSGSMCAATLATSPAKGIPLA